jgi:predicted DNA-binding WGR domain protein
MTNKIISHGHIIDDGCVVTGEIVEENGLVYSCSLTQTDLKTNKNRFYVIQLIKTENTYHLHKRWGRTGEEGRVTPETFVNRMTAINTFQKQFKTKTGNSWGAQNFVKKPGKYFLLDVSYQNELSKIDGKTQIDIPVSKLDERVQSLIKIISDVQMMKNTLVQLDIDTKKMPLGKLTQDQLDKAKDVLNEINIIVSRIEQYGEDSDDSRDLDDLKSLILDLSSKYYTYVPYACGRRKPPSIDSTGLVSKYRETVDDLANIAIGVNIINNIKIDENPVDAIYKDINTQIVPLNKNSDMWRQIDKYVRNTHGPSHGAKLEILDIFDIEQDGRKNIYEKETINIGNKTLLFHGTPSSCVLSIFKRHFYLDPTKLKSEAPVQIAGKMFGYGVYFSDMSTKSSNYCRTQSTGDIGCLILSEIALGNISKRYAADYKITKDSLEKQGFDSVLGVGTLCPESSITIDGVSIPNGKVINTGLKSSLKYNEFIVYDINQINIRYLILFKNVGSYTGY